MVRKIKAKAILRLNDQGLSGRTIARSLGITRQSVAEVLSASAAAGIAYPDVTAKPDDEDQGKATGSSAITCAAVHQRPLVTASLLWHGSGLVVSVRQLPL